MKSDYTFERKRTRDRLRQASKEMQMRSEIATAPAMIVPLQGYVFTRVETETAIIATIEELKRAGQPDIALVTIHLRYKMPEKNGQLKVRAQERAEQSAIYLLQGLRRLVRKTDQVFLCGYSMYFVLLAANLQGSEIVEERLWEALLWRIHSMGEQDLPRPAGMSIGHSAFPLPQTSAAELVQAAHAISRHFGEHSPRLSQRATRAARAEAGAAADTEDLPLLAKKLGIPYLTFLPSHPPRRVLQVVSARLARELRCYPVGRERNMLTVAMLNPQDSQALERLHQETGLRIFPVLTHPEALESALKRLG
jgi:hypothetical protein